MPLSPFQWEASFAFNILSIMGASVQFAPAVTSLLLGPSCYCSLVGINHLGPAPFSLHWLPEPLQTPIILWVVPPHPANSGVCRVFCGALGFVRSSVKLLQFAHLKIRPSHSWEGGFPGQQHGWARTGLGCTHTGIRRTPEAMWFIPLDHFMNL